MAEHREADASYSRDSPRRFRVRDDLGSPLRTEKSKIDGKMSPSMERLIERMQMTLHTPKKIEFPCLSGKNAHDNSEKSKPVDITNDMEIASPSRGESFRKIFEDNYGCRFTKISSPKRRTPKGRGIDDETLKRTLEREHVRRSNVRDGKSCYKDNESPTASVASSSTIHDRSPECKEYSYDDSLEEDHSVIENILPKLERSLQCIQLHTEDSEDELEDEEILERSLHEVSEVYFVLTMSNRARALAKKAKQGAKPKSFVNDPSEDIGQDILLGAIDERVGDLVSTRQKALIGQSYLKHLLADPLGESAETSNTVTTDDKEDSLSREVEEDKANGEENNEDSSFVDRDSNSASASVVAMLRRKFEPTEDDIEIVGISAETKDRRYSTTDLPSEASHPGEPEGKRHS